MGRFLIEKKEKEKFREKVFNGVLADLPKMKTNIPIFS